MAEKNDGNYWFIFSIADVIFITVLACILSGTAPLLDDPNAGVHVRVGEFIIENFTVPTHDIFSYTRPPVAWTPPDWFSNVIFAIAHKPFGLTGVVVFMASIIAAIYAILFKFLRSSGVSMVVAASAVLLAIGASGIHWLARPHIFSWMLLLIWYIILDTYQYKHKHYLYVLPFLMTLWVNLHGSFALGFILLLVYIAGNLLKAHFGKEERRDASDRTKVLILFFFLCLVASLLNPQGYKILLSPLQLATNPFVVERAVEWLSPNFHRLLIYELMLLLMILVLGTSMKRLNAIEAILLLLFTHMSLFSARFIALYALIVSPIIAKRVDRIIEELRGKGLAKEIVSASDNMAAVDSRTRWHLWSIGAMAVVVIACFVGKLDYRFDPGKMPVDAVRFLKKEKIEGKVFNNDGFGSYIIYEAWPEYEVFYDGRDMYGKERTEEYLKVADVARGWKDVLEKYDITWIIYNNESTLSNLLLEADDWRLVYSDQVANIFVKETPENQPLIRKYPNVQPVSAARKDDEERRAYSDRHEA
jgi:hypothetical protein